jgi:hypothetical protein
MAATRQRDRGKRTIASNESQASCDMTGSPVRLHNSDRRHDRKVAIYGLDSGYNAVGQHAVLDMVATRRPQLPVCHIRGVPRPGR